MLSPINKITGFNYSIGSYAYADITVTPVNGTYRGLRAYLIGRLLSYDGTSANIRIVTTLFKYDADTISTQDLSGTTYTLTTNSKWFVY